MYVYIFSLILLVYSVSSSEIGHKTQIDKVDKSLSNNCIDSSLKSYLKATNCVNTLNYVREALNEEELYDTLTQSDIVRSQYSKLPYPAVKSYILSQEKAYYDYYGKRVMAFGENRTIPISISFGITLEAINHFLYEGKNNFR